MIFDSLASKMDRQSNKLRLVGIPYLLLSRYLAIASFGQSQNYQVVLCIRLKTGENPLLVETLAQPFREVFNTTTLLDIMFLNAAQEADVKKVCRAFYEVA